MKTGFRLSRRAVLRGLGVVHGPARRWRSCSPGAPCAQAAKPLRFLTVYSPNGFLMNKWKPTATGTNWTTPPLLATLEPFRADFSMISGLGSYPASLSAAFGGSHTRACGRDVDPDAGGLPVVGRDERDLARPGHRQQDQGPDPVPVAAGGRPGLQPQRQLRGPVQLRLQQQHLLVGAHDVPAQAGQPAGRVQPAVRQRRAHAPMPMPGPTLPNKSAIYQKSILDVVSARADALRKRLGKTDRAKLDEYFNSVREVETAHRQRASRMPGTPDAGHVHPGRRRRPTPRPAASRSPSTSTCCRT